MGGCDETLHPRWDQSRLTSQWAASSQRACEACQAPRLSVPQLDRLVILGYLREKAKRVGCPAYFITARHVFSHWIQYDPDCRVASKGKTPPKKNSRPILCYLSPPPHETKHTAGKQVRDSSSRRTHWFWEEDGAHRYPQLALNPDTVAILGAARSYAREWRGKSLVFRRTWWRGSSAGCTTDVETSRHVPRRLVDAGRA